MKPKGPVLGRPSNRSLEPKGSLGQLLMGKRIGLHPGKSVQMEGGVDKKDNHSDTCPRRILKNASKRKKEINPCDQRKEGEGMPAKFVLARKEGGDPKKKKGRNNQTGKQLIPGETKNTPTQRPHQERFTTKDT